MSNDGAAAMPIVARTDHQRRIRRNFSTLAVLGYAASGSKVEKTVVAMMTGGEILIAGSKIPLR